MTVAVIVVCWNNEALLRECLESVRAQTIDSVAVRTILVDNGSSDGSVAFVHASFPEVEVVELGRNTGFASANNEGIRRALSDPLVDGVVLLNSDARLAPDWVEVVTSFAKLRPLGAAFQSLTVDAADPSVVDSHHLYLGRSLHASQFGATMSASEYEHAPSERVFGVNAAACLYSRAFLEAQPFDAYFDDAMFMYLEDVDLALRALVMGWESWYVKGTRAYHLGSASTKTQAGGFALRHTWRNQLNVLVTNLPWTLLLRGLIPLVRHERGAHNHLQATGQEELRAELRAGRRESLRTIRHALRRRKQLAPLRVVDPEVLWDLMRDGRVLR